MKGNRSDLHCLRWFTVKSVTLYTEPFRWTLCCGDVLCQLYEYISSCFGVYADQFAEKVGAMLYISSHLTFLMLAIIPPISLGVVGTCLNSSFVCMCSPWHNQVFYGRYWKKLSNKMQEALGNMSKASIYVTEPTVSALICAM